MRTRRCRGRRRRSGTMHQRCAGSAAAGGDFVAGCRCWLLILALRRQAHQEPAGLPNTHPPCPRDAGGCWRGPVRAGGVGTQGWVGMWAAAVCISFFQCPRPPWLVSHSPTSASMCTPCACAGGPAIQQRRRRRRARPSLAGEAGGRGLDGAVPGLCAVPLLPAGCRLGLPAPSPTSTSSLTLSCAPGGR